MADAPIVHPQVEACIDAIIDRVGREIVLGLPLGLGKPIHIVNALYRRAQQDRELKLHIVTAISPLAPKGSSSLESRFVDKFVQRTYGNIPELAYARDVKDGKLPPNVQVSEFFFQAGSFLNNRHQQQNYICTNYTHAVRDLMAMDINVVAQMVSPSEGGEAYSLSCNPDLSLDLIPLLREREAEGRAVAMVGEANRQLPYLANDAEVPDHVFDFVYDAKANDYPLFPVPQQAVSPADHLIGFYASTLIRDGGTLQVGIGSLGTAVVYSTIMRHKYNEQYQQVYRHLKVDERFSVARDWGGDQPFVKGLYGCSEMMVDGFIQLMKAGILTREVYPNAELQTLLNEGRISVDVTIETLDTLREAELIDSPLRARDVHWLQQLGIIRDHVAFKGGRLVVEDVSLDPNLDDDSAREGLASAVLGDRLKGGTVLHGGFYLGPADFYEALRCLTPEEEARICMTSVNFINHLYDHRFGDQKLKTVQRQESRFINSAMMCTLAGAVVSDGLDDGRVVSGVGGQYNFVAMAHELPRARSILTLRSTRHSGGELRSNIVFNYGHCTIPRHLRDIVITEYGIADLRGRSDKDVYLDLIRIADSRFQPELLKQAQKAGKVPASFKLPASWRLNTAEAVQEALQSAGNTEAFPKFPFGCEFTEEELALLKALNALKSATSSRKGKLQTLWRALREEPADEVLSPYLKRMDLAAPDKWRDRIDQRLLIHALRKHSL
ncbi:acetyl-CoA hydrolase/transferase C-terminal domain-containing protein [Marinobacter fonticola]|uniref:acetyl-CoA hydrolase/transferase C-terminal domain-containing protein n=1 Tax=Marinobacter fonticola TaxID=2603215 RepID=UPI0011E84826|nr:acetyl-CoA hydrolase/transferase C-terminal domain-containing protein [Marinobacter fonticola]